MSAQFPAIFNGRILLFISVDCEYDEKARELKCFGRSGRLRFEQSLEHQELRHESQLIAVEPFSQRSCPIEVGPG